MIHRLSAALALALIAASADAVQLSVEPATQVTADPTEPPAEDPAATEDTPADEPAAEEPAAAAPAAADTTCAGNKSGNCVNIDLKFDVKVSDPAADSGAAATADPAAGAGTGATAAKGTDPLTFPAKVTLKGTMMIGDIADLAALSALITTAGSVDAFKLTEDYTKLSAKDKAVADEIMANHLEDDFSFKADSEDKEVEITYTTTLAELLPEKFPADDADKDGDKDKDDDKDKDTEPSAEDDLLEMGMISSNQKWTLATQAFKGAGLEGTKKADGNTFSAQDVTDGNNDMTWADVMANINISDAATITNFKNNSLNYAGMSGYDKAWFAKLLQKEAETPDAALEQSELDVVALVWTQDAPKKGELDSAENETDGVVQVDSLMDDDDLKNNGDKVKWSDFRTKGKTDDAAYTDRKTLMAGIDYANLSEAAQQQVTNFVYAQEHQDTWTTDWSDGYKLNDNKVIFEGLSKYTIVKYQGKDDTAAKNYKWMDISAIIAGLGADETFECTGCTDEGKELVAALRHGSEDCTAGASSVSATADAPVKAAYCYRSYSTYAGEEIATFPAGKLE